MIIARIDGGLGNQMFQYAYGLYLANRHGTTLQLDAGAYAAQPAHGYLLDQFCLEAELATPASVARIPARYRNPSRRHWRDWLPGQLCKRHKESPFGFHQKHLQVSDNRYLVGYWQSEQFFPGMRSELLKQFAPCQPLTDASRRLADSMQAGPSVAVHVRRGDYVNNSEAARIYCHLERDYYLAAITDWAQRQTAPHIYVFSNDISWCRQNLVLPWATTFVDHNTAATAHEDLLLMSRASCCVIANSTFSWWGAWLNQRPDKVVYAPRNWFRPQTLDGSHIVPLDWRTPELSEPQRRAA